MLANMHEHTDQNVIGPVGLARQYNSDFAACESIQHVAFKATTPAQQDLDKDNPNASM